MRRRALSTSSSDNDPGSLLDLEALESGDEDDWSSCGDGSDGGSPASFPGFMKLPPELRCRIWEAFCPDLTSRARFLQFEMAPASMAHQTLSTWATRPVFTVQDGIALDDQTQSLRRVMAVHGESRAMALKVFPDSLSIDSGPGDAIVRFNKDRDVVFVNELGRYSAWLPNFAQEIVNVAIYRWASPDDEMAVDSVAKALYLLPNLRRIYFFDDDIKYESADLAWCTSDCANQYLTETFEKEPGLGEDTQSIACWPKIDSHADFAKFQIPRAHADGRPPEIDKLVREYGVETWPMILFDLNFAVERYRSLQGHEDEEFLRELMESGPEGSLGPSDSETDLDEYESEGIDDDEIIDHYDDSAEDHVNEGWSSSGAGFSSPEPETDGGGEAEPARRAPKRKIVADSDDDSPAPDEPRAKRARASRVVEDSDDESDEADDAPRKRRRRHAVAVSDSESDEDAGGAHAVPRGQGGSSPSDDDSDSGLDSSPPKQRASLAERLQLAREAHPIPASDSEGSSRTEGRDEDEDEDEDGAEDQEDQDGLIGYMAAESDGSGSGSSDEGW